MKVKCLPESNQQPFTSYPPKAQICDLSTWRFHLHCFKNYTRARTGCNNLPVSVILTSKHSRCFIAWCALSYPTRWCVMVQ